MRKAAILLFLLLFWRITYAQVVSVTNPGNTTPALAATYTSLANAITALNSITAISGPVTITLNAANPQTAPSGGYIINFTAATTNINRVIINGSNNTITAFSPQTAGATADALFKIVGADNVTLSNFVLRENPANTTTTLASNNMTEWGVALLCRSTTDGTQFNIILNNTISLNKNYSNTFGIYSNTRHSSTVPTVAVNIINNTTAPNHGNKVYGNTISNVNMGICFIGSGSNAANMDSGNDIGGTQSSEGNTISNFGGLAAVTSYVSNTGSCYGVFMNHQVNDNVSNNTIVSSLLSGSTINVRGIYKNYASILPAGIFTSSVLNNSLTLSNNFNGGTYEVIRCESVPGPVSGATIRIEGNIISGNSVGSNSGPLLVGINNTFACGTLEINDNIIRLNTSNSATGGFSGIQNSGAVVNSLSISDNILGDAGNDAITFSNATSGNLTGIISNTIAGTASISINNNFLQGFIQTVPGTGNFTGIQFANNSSAATTVDVKNNTFNSLTINTSGPVTLISRSGSMAQNAGCIETCSGNSVTNGFTSTGTGTLNIFTATGNSRSGNLMVQSNNNFSGLTGSSAIMNGWNNVAGLAADGPTIMITGNTFSNWNFPAVVNALDCSNGGNNSEISSNIISDIASGAFTGINMRSKSTVVHQCFNNEIKNISGGQNFVYGIRYHGTATSTFNAFGNTIYNLSITTTTSNSVLYGILLAPTLTGNVYKNRISNFTATAASVTVAGINVEGTSNNLYTIYNNIIGNLEAPQANANNVIRGIAFSLVGINSQMQADHNTIYLNASSSGTNFGSSGIFLTANATNTTGNTTLRNNLVVNLSTANGTGRTAALMRSSSTFANYNEASNNNIWYAGTPAPANLIFYNVTNSDQTLSAFKTRVGPICESNSLTELPTFLSVAGSSANFLHIDAAVPTQIESGALAIAGITDDADSEIRQGNIGYTGTGTAPDIGADEFEGIYSEMDPPGISYTSIASPTCTFSGNSVASVIIEDETGVPLAGANVPRIYYRKNSGAWFSQPGINTGGNTLSSSWNFTIVETDMGGLASGDIVEYFVIAQDLSPAINVASYPAGVSAESVHSISSFPPTPFSFSLNHTLSGLYTVGSGKNFNSLSEAINVYNNACALTGPVVFELTDNTYTAPLETFPIQILEHADASSINTLTIRPSLTSTPAITGVTTTQVINFNGSDHIIFDGRQGGTGTTREIVIRNEGTGIAVQFINDARYNIIKHCNVQSRRAGSFTGTILIGASSPSGNGNDHNTIHDNAISESVDFPTNAIYAAGTAGSANDSITISQNEIFNFFSSSNDNHGIFLNNANSSWNIIDNKFYQTAERRFTSTNIELFAIRIVGGENFRITGNRIGFANESGTGVMNLVGNSVALTGFPALYEPAGTATTFRFFGISADFDGGGLLSNIDGNHIGGLNIYSASPLSPGIFNGIYVENGTVDIGSNAANIIGSPNEQLSIYVSSNADVGYATAIRAASTSQGIVMQNIIGGILMSGTTAGKIVNFTGISAGGAGSFTIGNNQVGNSVDDNIRAGFFNEGGFLSNNGSLAPSNSTSPLNFLYGISTTSTGSVLEISENTLQGWQTAQNETEVSGIRTAGFLPGANSQVKILKNKIGTSTLPWINFSGNSNSDVRGISAFSQSRLQDVNENELYGFSYQNPVDHSGYCTLISTLNPTMAGGIGNISENRFINLHTRQIFTHLIESSGALTAGATRNIIGNTTEGNADIRNPFMGILLDDSSQPGSNVNVRNNSFTNITSIGTFYGIRDTEGSTINPPPIKKYTGNVISNIQATGGELFGFFIDRFGSNNGSIDSISNNIVTGLASDNSVTGIHARSRVQAREIEISKNVIRNLETSSDGQTVTGIRSSLVQALTPCRIKENIISNLQSTGSADSLVGINILEPSNGVDVRENKIYAINASGTQSQSSAISAGEAGSSAVDNLRVFNNLVGNIEAPSSGNTLIPPVTGIRINNQLPGGNAGVFNNSIHLTAASGHNDFSSACLYTNTVGNIIVENNLFSNLSATGSNGKAVVHWRKGADISGYTASINDLFAGVPAPDRLLYFDQTNSISSLSAYQAHMTPNEGLSISILPNFQSVDGDLLNFLHLNPFTNCDIIGKGSNDITLLERDFEGDERELPPPTGSTCDLGADEVSKWNTWTGTNGTAWNDPGNWSLGVVPNSVLQSVRIALPPPTNQPTISTGEFFQMKQLTISSGASLQNEGTVRVAGVLKCAPASINNEPSGPVTGSVELNGFCGDTRSLAGDIFLSNNIKNLVIGTNVQLSSNASEGLNIYGALEFGPVSGVNFHTGDNLVLVSNSSATARVGKVTGNSITGTASVERFINTGLPGNGGHPKSWQFLATPAKGQSIFDSWQEGGSTPPAYGTILTGTGSGFDITTPLPSIKYYDPAAGADGNWIGVANTASEVQRAEGYMVMVRGDRSVTTASAPANPTRLRIKGSLYQPSDPPPVTIVQPGKLASVGNPYASPVSVEFMRNNGRFINLNNDVIVWDPLLNGTYGLGGYQTLSAANNYEPTAGGTAYYPANLPAPHIQSGQAFFVRSSGSAGQVTFTEACKVELQRLVHRAHIPRDRKFFRAKLFTAEQEIADGNALVTSLLYADSLDENDAVKLRHSGENFFIRSSDNELSVESRNRIKNLDTIQYGFSNLREKDYVVSFYSSNMSNSGLAAYFGDRFLKTERGINLNDSSSFRIKITSDPASKSSKRFYVVFKTRGIRQVAIPSSELAKGKIEASVKILTNPVQTSLQLEITGFQPGEYNYTISSHAGILIQNGLFSLGTFRQVVEIPLKKHTSSGTYILRIYRKDESISVPFILVN